MSDDNNDESFTDDSSDRWVATGTAIALVATISAPVLIGAAGFGLLALSQIPQWLTTVYSFLVVMATIWAFGDETLRALLRAWSTVRGNGSSGE